MEIQLQDLTYSYKSAIGGPALQGVTASIGPGLHLLLGENGAGKTTLLHLIAGLLFPSTGTCKVDGCPTRLRLPSISSHIFISGVNLDLPGRTVRETVGKHARFYPHFSAELLRHCLDAFGLKDTDKLNSLSTGNCQKAKMAYALALRTDILLLDEPANGLDIESRKALQRLIAETISPEQTVIVSTHSVRELENLYDGVIDLHQGRLQYALTLDELQERVHFAVSDTEPEGAIYSELRIGRHHSILPNPEGRYSDPDYELLYMAARHAGQELLNTLNQQ